MDVREAIYGRRTVREFTTDPVEEAALRGLIDAAIQAPSAVDQQPWLFTIIRDWELLARSFEETSEDRSAFVGTVAFPGSDTA